MSKRTPQDDAAAMLASIGQRQSQRGSEPAIKGKQTSKQANKQTSKQATPLPDTEERVAAFSTYLRPSIQKRIKRLALELDRTTASLVEEAVEAFLIQKELQP
jgi:hypothetical protein